MQTVKLDKKVYLYVAVVFAVTFTLNLVMYLQRGRAALLALAAVSLQMFIPALAAVAFILAEKGRFKDYGLAFGGLRYYLLAYLLVVGYHLLHALVCTGLGLGKLVPLAESLSALAPGYEIPAAILVLNIFILAPLINLFFGFGEEFGWRGYLLNKLLPKGLAFTIIAGGVIWGLWHAPVILMGHNFPDSPRLGVLVMTLATIPLGAIFTWLRLKSGSAVVAGFAHGVFNGTVFLGGAFLVQAPLLWTNPVGLVGLPLLALLSAILFKVFPVRPSTEVLRTPGAA